MLRDASSPEIHARNDASRAERRKFRRKVVILEALLETPAGVWYCVVLNLSLGGVRLRVHFRPKLSQPVTLVLKKFGRFNGTVVWQVGNEIGVQFQESPEIVGRRLGATIPITPAAS